MAKRQNNALQLTLFPPETSWRVPRIEDLPQDWTQFKRISLDTEDCDLKLRTLGCGARRGAYVCGFSFAPEETGQAFYVPVRHLGGDNVDDIDQALAYLRHQLKHYTGEIVGARLGYDIDMLSTTEGVHFNPNIRFLDVQVAEPLIDELQYSYSLDNILKRHGLETKDEDLLREAAEAYNLKDVKKELYKLPGRFVGQYAEADVLRPLQLMRKQEEIIERDELDRAWDLGIRTLPVLVRMTQRGVRVDFDQLEKVERFSIAQETQAWGKVLELTGVHISVGDAMKAEVIAHALKAVDIIPPSTPKTGAPSITKTWLDELKHPVGAAIRRARKMSQLRTTFVASVRDHAVKGRIHCTFNQTRMEDESGEEVGAAFGRFSCQDPNMQQQPARDPEIGPMWRSVYVPDEGKQWASLDFSQQEPGLMLHFAVVSGPGRLGKVAHEAALKAAHQKYTDPTVDYHTMFTAFAHGEWVLKLDKKDPEQAKRLKVVRDPCKNIFLGICYGSGGAKVCHTLGLPTRWIESKRTGGMVEIAGEEGAALLAKVDAGVPWLRKTTEAVEAVAKERGYVKTLYGRRLHFESDGRGGYDWTYRAMNRIVQGSAAEQTAEGMIALDDMGAWLQLQIHDELALSASSREEAERYARKMEEAVVLKVPNRVDCEVGPSWGEAK